MTAPPMTPGPPSWEVFRTPGRGLAHQHVGTVRAVDLPSAAELARAAFGRRSSTGNTGRADTDGGSPHADPSDADTDAEPGALWLIPTARITASQPQRRPALFDPAEDKEFRHPGHYLIPEGVRNL